MKQVVTTKIGEITFKEVGEPTITPKQILLEMQYVGICGSDLHIFHGQHPFVPPSLFPLVRDMKEWEKTKDFNLLLNKSESNDLKLLLNLTSNHIGGKI